MDSNPWTLGFTYTAGSCFTIPHTYMSVEDRCGLPLTCACLLIYHINHQFIQLGWVSGILEKDERIMSLQKKTPKQIKQKLLAKMMSQKHSTWHAYNSKNIQEYMKLYIIKDCWRIMWNKSMCIIHQFIENGSTETETGLFFVLL